LGKLLTSLCLCHQAV